MLSGNKYKRRQLHTIDEIKNKSRQELIHDFVSLQNRVSRLEASEKEQVHIKEVLQKKTHALGERVKELNCLYVMSNIVEKHGASLERILKNIVKTIPPAWQYPDVAAARITAGDRSYSTPRFRITPWSQNAEIFVKGQSAGLLEVCYLEEMPGSDEGPFLKEERSLINVIAKRIGEIIEHTMAEEALKESMVKNRALLNAIPDVIFRVGRDGTILDFKKGKGFKGIPNAKKLIGLNIGNAPGSHPFFTAEVVRQVVDNIFHVMKTGESRVYEHRVQRNGALFHFEALLTMSGKDEVLGIIRDITERRRLEKQVLEISEWEQQRIGQDLHDSLSQQLAGIAYLGKALQQKLKLKSAMESRDIAEIVSLIDDAITQTKGLARGLHPVRLEANGLMTALSELARNVTKLFSIECRFVYDRPVLVHDGIVAIHLYRIAQEAVNNAIKHGKATLITIGFSTEDSATTLSVRNNGVGFRQRRTKGSGMGMSIMKHRAGMIGASLDIRNDSDGMTTVACSFQTKPDAGREKRT